MKMSRIMKIMIKKKKKGDEKVKNWMINLLIN